MKSDRIYIVDRPIVWLNGRRRAETYSQYIAEYRVALQTRQNRVIIGFQADFCE
ncbi:MAG: hypothetical protein OXN17_21415 [Candidatus Poribacteria bacterium]|nr:hypothetical protein [Candidatus Poribacteria bacterium]MDE0301196.1 hypothetical protein [Candidatus Poribacteria bacterium]